MLAEETEFAGRAVSAEAVGEVEGGSGAGGNCGIGAEAAEAEEAGGFVEAEAGTELAGCGAEDTAAEGGVECAEAVELDGDCGLAGCGADGAASATDGFAGEKELGKEAIEFDLPAGLFFAG